MSLEDAPTQTLREAVSALDGRYLPTDDLLHMALPLLRAVATLHEQGRVADLGPSDVLQDAHGPLRLTHPIGASRRTDNAAIDRVQPRAASALAVIGELRVTSDAATGAAVENLQVQEDAAGEIKAPVYLPGFRAWELALGHHDEITDIFSLGQILAALSLGLDFSDLDDLRAFAGARENLFRLNPNLNPVVGAVIVEMTELNRHGRAKDLPSLIRRLETYRDQPVGLEIERLLAEAKGVAGRRTAVLSHLRDRLFDLSRRNRLVHFRATQGSVNLTVASVPMVLRIQSIRPEHLATWGGLFSEQVLSGGAVPLTSWLRFEDQPYLAPSLDRLIQDARRDRADYGFSPLRLVAAFLRWHNLKEAPEERILSPLLWIPVELVKRKGVRDQYVLQATDDEAEFNPALRHYLRQLYDIRLPETVDLTKTSLEQIHADLVAQIGRTEPGVTLTLQTKPQIEMIHQKAVQRIEQFQRRRGNAARWRPGLAKPDFSYDAEDFRPLGLAIFREQVKPSALPLRAAVGAPMGPRELLMAPSESVEHATFAFTEGRGHRYAWELDLTQVTLANFNYKKMSLVQDYNQLIEGAQGSGPFDQVFSIEPRDLTVEAPPELPVAEQWNVVASDATQRRAVAVARAGRSFIIQGPPGTGKSQTITNLIADYVGQGKRVLFVCEKRAALDVVFHRLKQSGLEGLCTLIHDSQADKKAFVHDLRDRYADWAARPDTYDALAGERHQAAAMLQAALDRLQWFENALTAAPESLAMPVRSLVRRLAELPPADPAYRAKDREGLPDYAVWAANRELTGRLHRMLRQRLGVDSLAEHPFGRIAPGLVANERALSEIERLLEAAEAQLDVLGPLLDDQSRVIEGGLTLADAQALSTAAVAIRDERMADHLGLLNPDSREARAWDGEMQALELRERERAAAVEAAEGWSERLSPQDTGSALDLARRLEPSFFRFFSPAWWRLTGDLKRRYAIGRHAVKPTWTRVLETLAAAQGAEAAEAKLAAEIEARYGLVTLGSFRAALAGLADALPKSPALQRLVESIKAAPDPVAASRREAEGQEALQALSAAAQGLTTSPLEVRLDDLGEWMRDVREGLDDLPDALPLIRQVDAAHPAYAAALRTIAGPPEAAEALVAAESLQRLLRQDPELARFDSLTLAGLAKRAAEEERAGLSANAGLAEAGRRRQFLQNVRRASLSVTQLDEAGRRFKKSYSTGRRDLEHEFGKTMRYRSIRELATGESGLVINDLKPIWLMSPLSVSDTLPLSPDLFDVVIFDEASQIPMEDAVPALSRARQIVVVGDEMQLPPTSFFTATRDADEMEVVAEEDGERIAINLDADNLLTQSARNLPATLLAWHYRSRHEALISFSNAAFYEGRLITPPDRRLMPDAPAPITPAAADPEAARRGVDALLERPISYHQLRDGLYQGRANPPEAAYIAAMVRELLVRETGYSLGVVAFSEAQQGQIEDALEALAEEDAAFAARLEAEYTREDDDQFNGLFVKNLENVQGDERDIILMSVCYGPGPDGRMLMNFGPINQRGGEKRLNVIFSRARHRMAIVASIPPEAITNTSNDGAAALRGFLAFAQANSTGAVEHSQSILASLNAGAQSTFATARPADPIRAALAAALRARGHAVREDVGRSSFRCDLGIVSSDKTGYALGILLDQGAGEVDVRERYVFQPGVLRAFGWRIVDVLSQDWLKDPARVLQRIEQRLAAPDEEEDTEPADLPRPAGGPPSAPPPVASVPLQPRVRPPPPATEMPGSGGGREFRFVQGGSAKFWRIDVEGTMTTVTYGRIGSAGQSMVKTFDTPQRAAREAEKLIQEKLRKGYVEQA